MFFSFLKLLFSVSFVFWQQKEGIAEVDHFTSVFHSPWLEKFNQKLLEHSFFRQINIVQFASCFFELPWVSTLVPPPSRFDRCNKTLHEKKISHTERRAQQTFLKSRGKGN